MWPGIVMLGLTLAWVPRPIAAQEIQFSFADSVAIVTATLDAGIERHEADGFEHSDSLAIFWDLERSSLKLSPQVLEAVRQHHPGLTQFSGWGAVFDCPDGGIPRYPLNLCPLVEPGFVVVVNRFSVEDSGEIDVPFGVYSAVGAAGWSAILTRTSPDAVPTLTEIVHRWVS